MSRQITSAIADCRVKIRKLSTLRNETTVKIHTSRTNKTFAKTNGKWKVIEKKLSQNFDHTRSKFQDIYRWFSKFTTFWGTLTSLQEPFFILRRRGNTDTSTKYTVFFFPICNICKNFILLVNPCLQKYKLWIFPLSHCVVIYRIWHTFVFKDIVY